MSVCCCCLLFQVKMIKPEKLLPFVEYSILNSIRNGGVVFVHVKGLYVCFYVCMCMCVWLREFKPIRLTVAHHFISIAHIQLGYNSS